MERPRSLGTRSHDKTMIKPLPTLPLIGNPGPSTPAGGSSPASLGAGAMSAGNMAPNSAANSAPAAARAPYSPPNDPNWVDYVSQLPPIGPLPPLAARRPLPMSWKEVKEHGWTEVDVVIVTGDAYIDHGSFAMAILGRVLQAAGYRVAILSQPDWHSCEPWKTFGRPRLYFAISAGNMDSMINHYTASRKVRNSDAYSPGGRIGLRPDRATLPYCHRAREAYKDVPVIAGGVEASLRRVAHYDYWSDKVRRSILLDSKADLVAYGMGENSILEITHRLAQGQTAKDLRDMRGVAYCLGASETPPADALVLPSYEEICESKEKFALATKLLHNETNPFNARTLVQYHDRQAVVVNPPQFPIPQLAMDRIYDLPYTRQQHPIYKEEPVPAFDMIKDSVTIMRGCFGGCTFCSITAHQGRIIQSRSEESILSEVKQIAESPKFKGTISDIGGPTANMYQMRCTRPEVEAKCRRQSCVHPTICKLLGTDHGPIIQLMKKSREIDGIKKVNVASGIRMDLARLSPEYLHELAAHHVGGQLKVAPEHTSDTVLNLMRKPDNIDFEDFTNKFKEESRKVGKKQRIIPYYIASHPGSDINAMIELALFLKRTGYRPDQVQDFIPAPLDVATAMYYTGMDPFTMKPVYVAKRIRERKMQRALMQFFKPENYFDVREALLSVGRKDLIGNGCDCLIPATPPREAIIKRRKSAGKQFGDFVHQIDAKKSPGKPSAGKPSAGGQATEQQTPGKRNSRFQPGTGYRPERKSTKTNAGENSTGNLAAGNRPGPAKSAAPGKGRPPGGKPQPRAQNRPGSQNPNARPKSP